MLTDGSAAAAPAAQLRRRPQPQIEAPGRPEDGSCSGGIGNCNPQLVRNHDCSHQLNDNCEARSVITNASAAAHEHAGGMVAGAEAEAEG